MPIQRFFKQSLLSVPVLGSVALNAWRIFKDPYLGPIGLKISQHFPRWGKLTVVQIGANDGTRFDPICALLKNRFRWRALFVEPIPSVFEKLVGNYGNRKRFMFECAAVSDTPGVFNFYYLSQEASKATQNWQEYFDLVGSLDREHVVRALGEEAGRLEKYIVETQVPVITLQMLLDKWKVHQVDILVVDAEGFDWKIVSQAINLGLRPEVILFEHSNLKLSEREEVFR